MKKKKSKIIVPTSGAKDSAPQAFRCDKELKKKLDRLENKSEFIIKALWKAFEDEHWVTCPECKGKGFVKV